MIIWTFFARFKSLCNARLNGFRPRPGPLNNKLFLRQRDDFFCVGLAQGHEPFVPEFRAPEHFVKRRFQLRHQRALDFQAHVAPAGFDAVAFVFRRDVEAADERHAPVAHEQLAVVADDQAFQSDRIELPDFTARAPQRIPKMGGQKIGTDRVHEHADARAPLARANQRLAKTDSQRTVLININFQADRFFRRVNRREHRGKNFVARAKPVTGGIGFGHD